MRDFDTLRANIPPLIVVPGTATVDPSSGLPGVLGDGNVGDDYYIDRDGWKVEIQDPGKILTTSTFPSGSYYSLFGYHRTKIEWAPWARQDIALTPLGQDVVEGKNFEGFHTAWPGETISGASIPGWNGIVCKVLDIWSSEEIEDKMLENIAWNGDLPGAEASYPADPYEAAYYPKNDPININHKLRFDQVISARYRQMVSSTNAPTSQYFGGQLMTIHDQVVGGNASISESIHHARYVYMINSNNGQNNIEQPNVTTSTRFNYTKVGFFIPSAIDTLTVGLNKIESDAEWSTLARRGASR